MLKHNNTSTKSQASFLQANHQYQYEAKEIQEILASRLKDAGEANPQNFVKPVYMTGCANNYDPHVLESILSLERSDNLADEAGNARMLLIPCALKINVVNVMVYHWIGIFLEFGINNDLQDVILLDSLSWFSDYQKVAVQPLLLQLEKIYPTSSPRLSEFCLKQQDNYSCATYMIENFLRHAQNIEDNDAIDANSLRLKDLLSLKNRAPDFFAEFYPKQLHNQAANAPQISDEISDETDDLFKTLVALQNNTSKIFANDMQSLEIITKIQINENYQTVFDKESGRLKLQIKEAAKLKGITRVFATKKLDNGLDVMFSSYARGVGIGLGVTALGIGANVGIGIAASAITAASAGEIFIVEAMVFANPVLFVPGAVIGALTIGAMVTKAFFSRDFAFVVKEAFELYKLAGNEQYNSNNEKCNQRLQIAEAMLQRQFGGGGSDSVVGRNLISRGLRIASTTSYEKYFALLLLAQIKARRKNGDAIRVFSYVFDNASNKNLRSMALIGKISIWSQTDWEIKIDNRVVTEETKKEELDNLVIILNRYHKEIIQCYFDSVWQAFNLMFVILEDPLFIRSAEGFDKVKQTVETIRGFKDLHCFRYMEPHGELAEVAFSFAQAMSHLIVAQHYKWIQKITNDNGLHTQIDEQKILALAKIRSCQALMQEFGFENMENNGSDVFHTIDHIRKYIQEYLLEYEKLKEQAKLQHDLNMETQKLMFVNPIVTMHKRASTVEGFLKESEWSEKTRNAFRQLYS